MAVAETRFSAGFYRIRWEVFADVRARVDARRPVHPSRLSHRLFPPQGLRGRWQALGKPSGTAIGLVPHTSIAAGWAQHRKYSGPFAGADADPLGGLARGGAR